MPNGAELFVRTAVQLGIDTVFTLVGDHLNEVLAEAARSGMRVVDLRHESGVTHAADAWARIHRRPALSLVTGGPGHTNSLTGIATANLACSPLIAVSGSRPRQHGGSRSVPGYRPGRHGSPGNQMGRRGPVGRRGSVLSRAAPAQVANAGRKGAVHLTIPVDVFLSPARRAHAARRSSLAGCALAPECGGIIDLLRAAERPVVIAGSGVWWSGAEDALRRFIEHTSLPLYTITMARGAVSDDHPLVHGLCRPRAEPRRPHRLPRSRPVPGDRQTHRLPAGDGRAAAVSGIGEVHPDRYPRGGAGAQPAAGCAICGDARAALEALTKAAGAALAAAAPGSNACGRCGDEWQGD